MCHVEKYYYFSKNGISRFVAEEEVRGSAKNDPPLKSDDQESGEAGWYFAAMAAAISLSRCWSSFMTIGLAR